MEDNKQDFFNLGNRLSNTNIDSCVTKACSAIKKLIYSQTDKSLFDNRQLISKINAINFIIQVLEKLFHCINTNVLLMF